MHIWWLPICLFHAHSVLITIKTIGPMFPLVRLPLPLGQRQENRLGIGLRQRQIAKNAASGITTNYTINLLITHWHNTLTL